jgi:hypothetical protein
VIKSDSDFVSVKSLQAKTKENLIGIGFSNDTNLNEYKINTPTDEKKAEVFNKLRELDFCFSDGKEWCPAEIFEYLRDKGLLNGKFKMISWTSPDNYFITLDK